MISHNMHVWQVGVATRLQEMHVDSRTDTECKVEWVGLNVSCKNGQCFLSPKGLGGSWDRKLSLLSVVCIKGNQIPDNNARCEEWRQTAAEQPLKKQNFASQKFCKKKGT